MATFKVTACWYETVQVEAEDEDAAIDKAHEELKSEIRRNGYVDDYEVTRLDEDEDDEKEQPTTNPSAADVAPGRVRVKEYEG